MDSKKKVIIIGLDAGTFGIIDPLMKQNGLPNIEKMVKGGIRGVLLSTIPSVTIPAWLSFMTGKNPAKYGVFDFLKKDVTGKHRVINFNDVDAITIWELLDQQGKNCIAINIPGTYPPGNINGIIISGVLTPRNSSFISPPEIEKELADNVGKYRINTDADLMFPSLKEDRFLEDIFEVTTIQKDSFIYLLKKYEWDVAMAMFRSTDIITHKLWHKRERVEEVYRFMDEVVGEILRECGDENTAVFIVSDHGIGSREKDILFKSWLIKNGYLSVIRKKVNYSLSGESVENEMGKLDKWSKWYQEYRRFRSMKDFLSKIGISAENINHFLTRAKLLWLKRFVPLRIKLVTPKSSYDYEIDWQNTKAYYLDDWTAEARCMNINLEGREPHGIVKVGKEYEELRDEIISNLYSLKDPFNGDNVVERVFKREEIYSGKYLTNAPDISIILKDGYGVSKRILDSDIIKELDQVGNTHRREGILIAHGPNIKRNQSIKPCEIVDLMPTILHYLSVAVVSDVDGKVLFDIFDKDSEVFNREVRTIASEEVSRTKAESEHGQSVIQERLRALGYLD